MRQRGVHLRVVLLVSGDRNSMRGPRRCGTSCWCGLLRHSTDSHVEAPRCKALGALTTSCRTRQAPWGLRMKCRHASEAWLGRCMQRNHVADPVTLRVLGG